jgi:enolase
MGCRTAAGLIDGAIDRRLAGKDFETQAELDEALIALDGTFNKSRLGANTVLAVSLAFARAQAAQLGLPLYAYFAELVGRAPKTLPRLTINLFSGGKHAGKQVAIQDVLIVPASPSTVDESLVMMDSIYRAAAALSSERYGMRALVADEGGLAPPFESADAMIESAVQAIEKAGLRPGEDAVLALDVAASHFYEGGRYRLDGDALDSAGMIERVSSWVRRYPVVSVEDALAEEDWQHWPQLRAALAGKALTLGDDLLCTNAERAARAVEEGACDALLLKVNQVGTLSEAARTYAIARDASWQVTVSVRSGDTEDDWCADLAVGWSGDQFKNGSITRSERLAKYNRLLAIEADTGWPVVRWPGR